MTSGPVALGPDVEFYRHGLFTASIVPLSPKHSDERNSFEKTGVGREVEQSLCEVTVGIKLGDDKHSKFTPAQLSLH